MLSIIDADHVILKLFSLDIVPALAAKHTVKSASVFLVGIGHFHSTLLVGHVFSTWSFVAHSVHAQFFPL